MQVSELMYRSPVTCRREDCLDAPARLMWDHDIGSVPVVDENGHAVGVITDRDIAMAAYINNVPLSALRVGDRLSRALVSCLASDSLAHAELLMRTHQVRRLPVIDEFGKLVGLLTQHDLVREAINENRGRKREVQEHEVLRTLHEIGAPRNSSELAIAS